MKITKYDSLTTEELIHLAMNELPDDNELAIALCARLMDVQDELDQYKSDYENECAAMAKDTEARIEYFRSKVMGFVEGVDA